MPMGLVGWRAGICTTAMALLYCARQVQTGGIGIAVIKERPADLEPELLIAMGKEPRIRARNRYYGNQRALTSSSRAVSHSQNATLRHPAPSTTLALPRGVSSRGTEHVSRRVTLSGLKRCVMIH
jgi:hypothetical protein